MVIVELRAVIDNDPANIGVLARLEVAGREMRVTGDESVVDPAQPVVSVSLGRAITFEDDPEEWARSLPTSLRTPYLFAEVIGDDYAEPEPLLEDDSIQVRPRVS